MATTKYTALINQRVAHIASENRKLDNLRNRKRETEKQILSQNKHIQLLTEKLINLKRQELTETGEKTLDDDK